MASRPHPTFALSMMLAGGILWRVAAMTVVNYVVLLYVAPIFFHADYLSFARMTLEQTTGWSLTDNVAVLVYTLLFIGSSGLGSFRREKRVFQSARRMPSQRRLTAL